MSKNFNLLLLHFPIIDRHPRTWICMKGPDLKNLCKELEQSVLKNQDWTRERASKEVSKRLNCSKGVIKRILQGKCEFYPIPVILELSKFSRSRKKILVDIEKNIESLKVNSASAKPIKAVRRINENLAKILGAFMADGSFSMQTIIEAKQMQDLDNIKRYLKKLQVRFSEGKATSRNKYYMGIQINKDNLKIMNEMIDYLHCPTQTHYSIELTEEYKDNVKSFKDWVKSEFDISPNRFAKMKQNAWRIIFSNKILARYLMTFFDVKPGPKTYDAFESKVLQQSTLGVRRAFAKGVLMFDGCVTKQNKISLDIRSKNLFESIKEIWEKDKIKFGERIYTRKHTGYYIREKSQNFFKLSTTERNRKSKLLMYFEKNTQKWKLLQWLAGDTTHTPIIKTGSGLSHDKILLVLKRIKLCDARFLENHFGCGHSTIRNYLKVLQNQGRIDLSNKPDSINDCVHKNTTVLLKKRFHKLLFKKIKEKLGTDKNFASFLDIKKGTLSAWRTRKNRMPVYILKEMCEVLNLDFNEASKNIAKTDREIAKII